MKLPGRSWLEFRVESADADTSRLTQTAFFARRGLSGLLYSCFVLRFWGEIAVSILIINHLATYIYFNCSHT